jgi:hypothetical protein
MLEPGYAGGDEETIGGSHPDPEGQHGDLGGKCSHPDGRDAERIAASQTCMGDAGIRTGALPIYPGAFAIWMAGVAIWI